MIPVFLWLYQELDPIFPWFGLMTPLHVFPQSLWSLGKNGETVEMQKMAVSYFSL